jgi:hypothetical protein
METRINILDYLGFDSPTKEQAVALNAMSDFVKEDNTEDFLTLCGAAGTGKSTITFGLFGYLISPIKGSLQYFCYLRFIRGRNFLIKCFSI